MRRSVLGWTAVGVACLFGAALVEPPAAAQEGHERHHHGAGWRVRAAAASKEAKDGVDPGPTPRATCGPRLLVPRPGCRGRVSAEDAASGRAAQGYTCNAELVSTFGES